MSTKCKMSISLAPQKFIVKKMPVFLRNFFQMLSLTVNRGRIDLGDKCMAEFTTNYLMNNSHLPGPRGNLELLYEFANGATKEEADKCLAFIKPDTANSPEEFVGMCGVLAYAILHRDDNAGTIAFLAKYAAHASWRIREAVAMGIQEISIGNFGTTLENIGPFAEGSSLEQRAVVAGLCEPKLLKDKKLDRKVLSILYAITKTLAHDEKLEESADSLRKALGYGWSVVVASSPEDGKKEFEKLFALKGKHVRWIIRENLKKNRLTKMHAEWVAACAKRLASN